MEDTAYRAIAVVGIGAALPDAPDASTFWANVKGGRYSISEVTPDRWDPAVYYDADPKVPDKTYSKIGGWVRECAWDPIAWHLPIPPRVSQSMDDTQKWAVKCTHEALTSFGYPNRPLDLERTAVIFGNAMAGERHYLTSTRLAHPEFARELSNAPAFAALPADVRATILQQFHANTQEFFPNITEDTMPGELSNCIAGRVANLFNLHGPNYVCDAACASAMAAMSAAIEGLVERDFDTVITGGIDRNMGIATFVKFCKIGALSATGTRPYADGSDGFVMGEGAAIFVLKRLEDAERDGDTIYAVMRGMGGSSDGRGKGITAPNPIGQRIAIERGWKNAGLSPATATLIEGHGTSTKVGDVVEVQSLIDVFTPFGPATQSIALGSVKSNIGHLKGAAGASGMLKVIMALHEKVLPPSLNFHRPNPNLDFAHSPFYVNTELKPWPTPACGVRRAAVSAFGFGGTNFHAVFEEYIPGRLKPKKVQVSGIETVPAKGSTAELRAPFRGALVLGGTSSTALIERLKAVQTAAQAGNAPEIEAPAEADLRAPERIAIDYADAKDLADKAGKALKALETNNPAMWKALRSQGVFHGSGPAPKVAFLYTGQGSQYVNMLQHLRDIEPVVAEVFAEADKVMTPLLGGKSLSDYIFVQQADEAAVAQAEKDLRQTAITQPAVLAVDSALTKLMASYGIKSDMVMGHSLGEYGALVAAEAMPFADALEAVSARGREMTKVSMGDNGKMAAVFAPLPEIERILKTVDGYVVIANINSNVQAVIGGISEAVAQAEHLFKEAGYNCVPLPVSHAFHTTIVAPASGPLRQTLERLTMRSPKIPTVANINGEFYPTGPNVKSEMLDILAKQVASPVQFVKGLHTLYEAGARIFVEVGPKKALQGFVDDVLGHHPDVISLATNHPKTGDVASFNQALCGLYAAGLGAGRVPQPVAQPVVTQATAAISAPAQPSVNLTAAAPVHPTPSGIPTAAVTRGAGMSTPNANQTYVELGKLFAEFLERGMHLYQGQATPARAAQELVVISGAALGLPGVERVFDEANLGRILRGEQFIDVIPAKYRRLMVEKHITRLVKSDAGARFEAIESASEVVKLAARAGIIDLEHDFGIPADRLAALDEVTQLAIGAGIDALRDAGIPLVLRYKTTTKGTQLPDRWGLPEALRDETGVIFASAFPGYDSFASSLTHYWEDHARHQELEMLTSLRSRLDGQATTIALEIDRRIGELNRAIEAAPFQFDRRFLFRVLAMGHSQFAELIGARGPNTAINSACASTTQAVALAEDWIHSGRCRRVVVVAADDVTSDNLMEWFGAGFLATGAAATDDVVEEAATPFDRRRHGMILGMGAASFVIESAEASRERGIQPICEVLSTATANSAFHGTRLDVNHICMVMEKLVSQAEARTGINRHQIAPQTVFVSHETYTPARGGSAAAEVHALRQVFGDHASQLVIANTKGFTGHPMGVGIEDVIGIKAIETGIVPPVANFKEVDPDLGVLNLSKGGAYPVQYALRLGAGFGSQISMTLIRWIPTADGMHRAPDALGYEYRIFDRNQFNQWLSFVSGYQTAEMEVVNRTLRIKDQGTPAVPLHTGAAKPIVNAPATSWAQPAMSQPSPAPAVIQPAAKIEPPKVEPVLAAPQFTPVATPLPVFDLVKEKVLNLAAQKTGYPVDMLDLDLDLEADLGVDTVKQAEMFAAIRGAYDIPREETLKLRDFPTLKHVIQFVYDRRPDLKAVELPPLPARVVSMPSGVGAAPALAPVVAVATIDPVREEVLKLTAQKTGYPIDMLDMDLDLEADLGVDTVKQAEMFAAIRAAYTIPRDENLKLRDFPTLKHVIQFVYDRRPDLKASEPAAPTPVVVAPVHAQAPVAAPEPVHDEVTQKVMALAAEKTGYPPEMLDLDLDLEADLGVDTVKQAEMFASVRAIFNIARDENLKLRDFPTLKHVIGFVYDKRPDLKVTAAPAPVQPVAAPVAEAAPAVDEVTQKVLDLAVEKTGYPPEMLDLDLDLEADLGVDTVKQAEMFASVRGMFDIPRDENLKLRDFPTLSHVIGFVYDKRPDLKGNVTAQSTAPSTSAAATVAVTTPATPKTMSLDAAAAIPRRVPVPILRPALTDCKPTGVRLEAGTRVIVMPELGDVTEILCQKLANRGVEVLKLDNLSDAASLTDQIQTWLEAGPIHGVYWLPALAVEDNLFDMHLEQWRAELEVRVKYLYATMRVLYDQIQAAGTFLVSAVHLDGQHGYGPTGARAPLGGAVTGFTKAYKRERTEALVKTVDFQPDTSADEIAETLIAETLTDPGAVEIGYAEGNRWTVGLREIPVENGEPGMELNQDTVFVVTGAAGSIVSAITTDLAVASGGTFYLLDLVPEPDRHNPDIPRLANDKDNLKRDIFERLKARGERATPAMVEKELAALERASAALTAIQAIEAAGGTAHYFSVDLRDAESVGNAIDAVQEQQGRIDVLLHAAGLEISRFLKDKEPREFDLVFDVKCDGWFNLLRSIGQMPLGATVVFSSIAGRFGNGGQTDYSSANDLLCKTTSSFRTTRPNTRGIATDWTAWSSIGMASRGSIPKMMELAGIDMLAPEAGIPFIRRELISGSRRDEIVVAERLGLLMDEFDATGGLDVEAINQQLAEHREAGNVGPMIGNVTGFGLHTGLTIETTLDPKEQPFLFDHQIEGTPVLPGVMGMESFAELAAVLFPDRSVASVENVDFLAPFKFYRHEPRTIKLVAKFQTDGEDILAFCRLIGTRTLPNQPTPQETVHFTGTVRLTRQPLPEDLEQPATEAEATVNAEDIYRIYFHGPAYQVLEKIWKWEDCVAGQFAAELIENHRPMELETQLTPRLIELCFQTAGIWEIGETGHMGLPLHVDRVLKLRTGENVSGRQVAIIRRDTENNGFDGVVCDGEGNVFLYLQGYRTVEFTANDEAQVALIRTVLS
ncbi:MAG: SDR family NAD(P)-dependent oxidoreductase [Acidobacteria bacterium]|nr:SDR family NAD(P)-dependent oxidoreductase [Acidobacteriota bacterium]